MNTPPSLFTVALVAPITLAFLQLTTGKKYQRPPYTITELDCVITDDGSTVSAQLNRGQIPLRLILWSKTTTPPYSSTPPGTGSGDTWTNATCQARVQELIGSTSTSQLAAVRALFPANQIVF